MRIKIAPTLSWHFDQAVFGSDPAAIRDDARQMRAELRALLAVARALRLVLRFHGTRADVDTAKQALAHLDRLSGRKP